LKQKIYGINNTIPLHRKRAKEQKNIERLYIKYINMHLSSVSQARQALEASSLDEYRKIKEHTRKENVKKQNRKTLEEIEDWVKETSKPFSPPIENPLIKQQGNGFFETVMSGNISKVNQSISMYWGKKDVLNWRNSSGATPLIAACSKGDAERVFLLSNTIGIDVNAADENGCTGLWWAAFKGDIDIVNILLNERDLEINLAPRDGKTPLVIAREEGHEAVVARLNKENALEINGFRLRPPGSNAKTNPPFKNKINQLIYNAAKKGDSEKLEDLLNEWSGNKSALNWRNMDDDGRSALVAACYNGHVECVRALVNTSGVDVNLADKNGQTGLFFAVYNGNLEVVKELIAINDINPYIAPNKGEYKDKTPLMLALDGAEKGLINTSVGELITFRQIETILRKAGVRLRFSCKPDVDPSLKVISSMNVFFCKIFMCIEHKFKYKWNEEDAKKRDELFSAAENGTVDILKEILDTCGNVFILNWHSESTGETPLTIACANNNIECVKELVDTFGVRINEVNKKGETGLFKAASKGNADVVSVLVAVNGIEMNKAPYAEGEHESITPLEIAKKNGFDDIVRQLAMAGAKSDEKTLEKAVADTNAIAMSNAKVVFDFLQERNEEQYKKEKKYIEEKYKQELMDILNRNKYMEDAFISHVGGLLYTEVQKDDNDKLITLLNLFNKFLNSSILNWSKSEDESDEKLSGASMLLIACINNNAEMVKTLINIPDVDVNFKNNIGRTALMYACEYEYLYIIKLLLEHQDINVNFGDTKNRTALWYAVKEEKYKAVALSIQHPHLNINTISLNEEGKEETLLSFAWKNTLKPEGKSVEMEWKKSWDKLNETAKQAIQEDEHRVVTPDGDPSKMTPTERLLHYSRPDTSTKRYLDIEKNYSMGKMKEGWKKWEEKRSKKEEERRDRRGCYDCNDSTYKIFCVLRDALHKNENSKHDAGNLLLKVSRRVEQLYSLFKNLLDDWCGVSEVLNWKDEKTGRTPIIEIIRNNAKDNPGWMYYLANTHGVDIYIRDNKGKNAVDWLESLKLDPKPLENVQLQRIEYKENMDKEKDKKQREEQELEDIKQRKAIRIEEELKQRKAREEEHMKSPTPKPGFLSSVRESIFGKNNGGNNVKKNKSRIKNIKNSRKTRKVKKKYSRKMRNK